MTSELLRTIVTDDAHLRNRSLEQLCGDLSVSQLLHECSLLDDFRRRSDNLYERVRALFFLSAIYRYQLPSRLPASTFGRVPYAGYVHLLNRRFDEAIDEFLAKGPGANGPGGNGPGGQITDTSASALAVAWLR